MRPVIDLSVLDQHLIVPHFKMETNKSIMDSIHLGMWTTSLDLTDAYFHIPISHKFRKCLRFVWEYQVMPFGLSTAPLVLTRICQAVVEHLHSQSIFIHSYFNDSLLKNIFHFLLGSSIFTADRFSDIADGCYSPGPSTYTPNSVIHQGVLASIYSNVGGIYPCSSQTTASSSVVVTKVENFDWSTSGLSKSLLFTQMPS